MKIVQVVYTTKREFATKNSSNIRSVMNDLRRLNHAGINYNTCLGSNGKTFIHTAFFDSEQDQKILNKLPSFQHFQDELKASIPESLPKQDFLTIVGSSNPILHDHN